MPISRVYTGMKARLIRADQPLPAKLAATLRLTRDTTAYSTLKWTLIGRSEFDLRVLLSVRVTRELSGISSFITVQPGPIITFAPMRQPPMTEAPALRISFSPRTGYA